VPALIASGGDRASLRFLEFSAANIRNPHTRRAYAHAAAQFMTWCDANRVGSITAVQPLHVAAWIEQQTRACGPDRQAALGRAVASVRLAGDRPGDRGQSVGSQSSSIGRWAFRPDPRMGIASGISLHLCRPDLIAIAILAFRPEGRAGVPRANTGTASINLGSETASRKRVSPRPRSGSTLSDWQGG